MRTIKNRFLALLVVFTSVVSFLPVGFSGQAVKAADEATTVRVNIDEKLTPLTTRTDATIEGEIYTTKDVEDAFDITVKDVRTTGPKLKADAESKRTTLTGIIDQKVIVLAINETKLVNDNGTPNSAGEEIVKGMGITIDNKPTPVEGDSARLGVRISGLPAGVNKIKYQIKTTTQVATYKADIDANGKILNTGTATLGDEETKVVYEKSITIEHASGFVIDKVQEMMFKAYVGENGAFSDTDEISDETQRENNGVPFLYLTKAASDPNMPLRFNFDVPDSLSSLKYKMDFGTGMLNLNDAVVYKNGTKITEGVDYDIENGVLSGDLEDLTKSDLIVIKVNSESNGTSTKKIAKAYAIEIRYNRLLANEDYSMKNAGITKRWFNDDSSVKAYVGKKFTVTKDVSGFPVYHGEIYIDSRAEQVSLDPTLIVPKANVAYSVLNRYSDGTVSKNLPASLSGGDGKKYVDFKKGSSNQLQISVYKGDGNGNITDSSKILAQYLLDVKPIEDSSSTIGLQFSSTPEPYLRQPGVKDNILDFNPSRVTYDLCFGNVDTDKVADPVTITYTGNRSNKNEYIKVFYSNSVDGSNFTETEASKNNTYGADLTRNRSVDVSLGNAKKIYVQMYYDKFVEKDVKQSDGSTKKEQVLVGSYPAGSKYVFYLPNNDDGSDNPTPGETSKNALLNSLKVKGYTLIDSDGNEGFSGEVNNYTVTVLKEDTTAKITAIPEDDNVKSIVATIGGTEDTYDLFPGEESEIPLSSTGKTNIKIVVTAQDGITTTTYSLLIKNNTKGSNANLKNVILSSGDYTFNPKEDITKVRVDQNINTIKVTPIAEDSKSKVSVNGQTYSDTAISVSLKGSQKTEVQIEVVSEDGEESKTYTLEIYRVDVADWEDNSGDSGDQYDDDQFYDDYNDCWVDLTKYDEWGTINGKPAYFDKKGRQVKNAWISTGGKYYYLNNVGYRASGWKVDDQTGQTYYLDPSTGEMKLGWMNLNNIWYYMGKNGVMHKGWLNLNRKWYYFTPNGQMVVNQTMFVDDKVYKFGQDGAVIFS